MRQVIEVGDSTYELSRHAIERALDMDIDGGEIRQALECPTRVRYSPTYGTTLHDFGKITVTILPKSPGRFVVTTILWRNERLWRRDLQRGDYAGRSSDHR